MSRLGLLICLIGVTLARTTYAQPSTLPEPAVVEAKDFFEQGESLFAAKHYKAALEAYEKSRKLVPRASNTLNVAVSLHALKRYDEAYDTFEEALTKFPEDQLTKEARSSARKAMGEIETKIGCIDISTNVNGSLIIDGRQRGNLLSPVHILPGKHTVRVVADGFETFEETVEVMPRQTTTVSANLKPFTPAVQEIQVSTREALVKIETKESRPGEDPKKHFAIEVFGGYGFAIGGNTSSVGQDSGGSFARAGVTGSYELTSGLNFFMQGGYLNLSREMSRDLQATLKIGGATTYSLKDNIVVSGPFVASGVGYRFALSESFDIQLRLSLGAAFINAKNNTTEKITENGMMSNETDGFGPASSSVMFLATPEITAGLWLNKNIRLTIGAAFTTSLIEGPRMKLNSNDSSQACATTINCRPGQNFNPDLGAYGQFVTFTPQIGASYWF